MDKEQTESSILTLFSVFDGIRKGKNLEHILSKLKLIDINPYLLSDNSLHKLILNKRFSHDRDIKILFEIISTGVKKAPTKIVQLIPNLILLLQKKKKIEMNREQNLNTFISKTTMIMILLALSFGLVFYVNVKYIFFSDFWTGIHGFNGAIIEKYLLLTLLADLFISISIGISLILVLLHSLSRRKLLSTLLVRWIAVVLSLAISYMMINLLT